LDIHSFIHPHLSSDIHSTLGPEHTSAKLFASKGCLVHHLPIHCS
jgi:hypothetical protein